MTTHNGQVQDSELRRPPEIEVGAAALPQRVRHRPQWSWLGLVPFFGYAGLFFLLPVGVLLWTAFQDSGTGAVTVDNVRHSLQGAYLSGLGHSVQLSLVDALAAALLGLPLAQAIRSGRGTLLPRLVSSASAVLANFGGLPLAFLFVAAIGNAGVLTTVLHDRFGVSLSGDLHFDLYSVTGVEVVYLYFLVPLMVLVITPALEGLRPQWRESAENLGASRWQYWRHVAGPVLAPSVLGAVALLFCSAFSAYATAAALTNGTLSLTPLQIGAVLSGNVLTGQENVGAALALNMVVVVVPLTMLYLAMQRRTQRWLQ
ncbi:MAG TPA: ABC transporter permease subunit [Rugosimonospora sp.]|nr:ABC transporter permease subunit [Rugosimonospora sp.]